MTDHLERRLRVRRLVAAHGRLLLTLSLLLIFVGGGVTASGFTDQPTTTEERTLSSWTHTGVFDHGAMVTRENPAYPVGTRLENRSQYFLDVTPVVNLTYGVGYRGVNDGQLTAIVRLRVVRQGVGGDGETLWTTTQTLTKRNQTLAPGERLRVPVALDVPAVTSRTRNISNQLGGNPTTAVVAKVRLVGTVDGRRIDRSFSQRIEITTGGETYSLTGQLQARESVTRTETVVRRTNPPLPARALGPTVLSVGLLGGVGLVTLQRTREIELSTAERRWLSYRRDRDEYAEWIHAATVPAQAREYPRSKAQSLQDLVDIAIDLDATVIETPETGRLFVVGDQLLYVFEPPTRPDAEAGSDDQ